MPHLKARLFGAAALVVALASPALAGPPLLCHPFDIGGAKSLPWDGAGGWFVGRGDYPLSHLIADTEGILQPSTPVVVRMETLRRAAIYASRDLAVAQQLLSTLQRRVSTSGERDALASSDAAYYIEALREVSMLDSMAEFKDHAGELRRLVADANAGALIRDAMAARPDDPALAFEAALITSMVDRAASRGYAEKARAGAAKDALVARNIDHLS